MRPRLQFAALACAVSLVSVNVASAADYTITQISPSTQFQPVLDFTGPYFDFEVTNNSASDETFNMEVQNLSVGTWFPQVCDGLVCFPSPSSVTVPAGQTKILGVNVVPLDDNVGTFDFYIEADSDPADNHSFSLQLFAGTTVTDVPSLPAASLVELRQNSPNPVRATTDISFSVQRPDIVQLRIFDVAGRLVETLVDGAVPAGAHEFTWDARGANGEKLQSGVYFYRLETSQGSFSKQMTLIR